MLKLKNNYETYETSFRIFKDCLEFFKVKTINCVFIATQPFEAAVQHSMYSLCNSFEMCRLKVNISIFLLYVKLIKQIEQ